LPLPIRAQLRLNAGAIEPAGHLALAVVGADLGVAARANALPLTRRLQLQPRTMAVQATADLTCMLIRAYVRVDTGPIALLLAVSAQVPLCAGPS